MNGITRFWRRTGYGATTRRPHSALQRPPAPSSLWTSREADTSGVVAEEAGQEDKNPFNFTDFNQIVLGTNRLQYMVNGAPDPTHIDNQIHYITSASRKENEAFMACEDMRRSMMDGKSQLTRCSFRGKSPCSAE